MFTTSDMKRRTQRPPSFTDLLPWVEYLPESRAFLLEDGMSVGALFEITPVVNNQVGNTRPRVIDENGVLVKDYENYRLFVQTISTTTSFDRSDLPINKVILTNTAGVTSLDLATMGELLLGALPTQTSGSFNGVSIDNFRYGDAGLGFATAGTGPTQLIDLYYADANAAGSLRRITNNIQ